MDSQLQRYRRDRRKLLDFLLSSDLIKEIRTPSGPAASLSAIDYEALSAEYVLQCVKSGGIVDVAEATKTYHAESAYPIMSHSKFGDSYYLTSDPDSAGSPPRCVPPLTVMSGTSNHASCSSGQQELFNVQNVETSENDKGLNYKAEKLVFTKPEEISEIASLGLPRLSTGLSDDDLRESAYELLLASILCSGIEVCSIEDRKKEKSSKFLSGLKSKRDKSRPQSQSSERHSALIDTIRAQMQISEVMDACIKRNMVQLAARRTCGIDLPQISLGFLIGIYKSDFLNQKYYIQWKSRQAHILEEHLYCAANLMTAEYQMIRSCLARIRDTMEWDVKMTPSQRVEVLASIRQVASKLSSLPGQFGIQGETYYWTAAYHLNIRLYERLLYGLFDILDEGQLIKEADAILLLIKLTWSTLGITQKIHNALYGFVLFQQFVVTDEGMLLDHAILELQRVKSAEEDDEKEGQFMNSIVCSREFYGSEKKINLVQAIFLAIGTWCESKLQDYHLYFSQKPSNFRRVMALASAVRVFSSSDHSGAKLSKLSAVTGSSGSKIKTYVERSTEAVFRRVKSTKMGTKAERTHPLALLASELRVVAERELNVFFPVLRQWCPEYMMITTKLLHQLYGETLIPFLHGVSSCYEDARSVLSAAYMLDHELSQLYTSAFEANTFTHSFSQHLDHYQIEEVSGPLIHDWVIGQHTHILEWTRRALDLEDWEPLSFHQRQAASIIEVFRIIEETVDQFFSLNLPMDVTHLQALLSEVYHSLDGYLLRMVNQLVEKNHLYPSAPPLTRYTEAVIPIIKKRLHECTVLDDNMLKRLEGLTIPKLCIRLNTLQYIQKQLDQLEDGIRNSWANVRPSLSQMLEKEPNETLVRSSLTCSEAVDELFDTTFNSIRHTATSITKNICSLIGARVVFWDLRDKFLFHIYRGSVEFAHLESFLTHVDTVLDHICGLIDDATRDLVVLSVFQASLEGFVWILLDGGPSRAFSDADIILMEEDLNMLKEFFIADGEGLPRSLVDQEAKLTEQILSLFSLQSETLIQMLMNASEGISVGSDSHKNGHMHLEDAHTLVRVLCHKKDREASKFLKRQYQLPMSSEYEDTPSTDSTQGPALISDLKQRTSFRWIKKRGYSSFKSIKK